MYIYIHRILKFPWIEVSMTIDSMSVGHLAPVEAGTFDVHRHPAAGDLALWQDSCELSKGWTELGSSYCNDQVSWQSHDQTVSKSII